MEKDKLQAIHLPSWGGGEPLSWGTLQWAQQLCQWWIFAFPDVLPIPTSDHVPCPKPRPRFLHQWCRWAMLPGSLQALKAPLMLHMHAQHMY